MMKKNILLYVRLFIVIVPCVMSCGEKIEISQVVGGQALDVKNTIPSPCTELGKWILEGKNLELFFNGLHVSMLFSVGLFSLAFYKFKDK